MTCLKCVAGCLFPLLLRMCACAAAPTQSSVVAQFVGSTACGALPREFLGGIAPTAACHVITWRLTLLTNHHSGAPCKLSASYGIPARRNPHLTEQGPRVEVDGTWAIVKGTKSNPDATVYQISAGQPERTLSFVKVSDELIHLLTSEQSLMVGNGGWSYTLNRADRAEKPATKAPGDRPAYTISPRATGPTVFGVFEGRTPCQGISGELGRPFEADCHKLKWRVTLFQNPETSAPTTCKVEGTLYWQGAREGTWSIIRGTETDPAAIVYRLEPTRTESALLFLKGDDNVLFFLNQRYQPLVGHTDFSYTLNRAEKD